MSLIGINFYRMNVEEFFQKFSASTESKCSCKLETNSRGTNITLHVYEGAETKEINDTIDKTIKGLEYANKQVNK